MNSTETVYRNPVPFAEFSFFLAKHLVQWGIQPEELCKLLDTNLRGTGAYSLHNSLQNNALEKTHNPVTLNAYFINRWVHLQRPSTWPNCDDLVKLFCFRSHRHIRPQIRELCEKSVGTLKITWTGCRERPQLQISKTGNLFAFCEKHDLKSRGRRPRKRRAWCHPSPKAFMFEEGLSGESDCSYSESNYEEGSSAEDTDDESLEERRHSVSATNSCNSDSESNSDESDDLEEALRRVRPPMVVRIPISSECHAALENPQNVRSFVQSKHHRLARRFSSESDDSDTDRPGASMLGVKRPYIEPYSDDESDSEGSPKTKQLLLETLSGPRDCESTVQLQTQSMEQNQKENVPPKTQVSSTVPLAGSKRGGREAREILGGLLHKRDVFSLLL